ncbi:MAG: hypothetical protein NT121_04235 [Chloroflexi bacterium]|nr:hypothetical protein [Chloroflexota bacterium]
MGGDKSIKKANEIFVAWSMEGVKGFYTQFIADVAKQAVAWFVASSFGPWILAGIIGFLIFILKWLQFPISLPAYAIALIFLLFILSGRSYKNLRPKLAVLVSRLKEETLYGLLWKIDKDKNLTGPLCPTCHSIIIFPTNFKKQAEDIGDFLLGTESIYTYRCSACDFHKELNMDKDELVETVTQALGMTTKHG